MLRCFYPDEYVNSAYEIDYDALYKEGFRGLLFDIDNTLVPHGKDATREAIEFFKARKKQGFSTCLISNNKKPRVVRFNEKIQTNYLYDAHKPSIKGYQKAMKLMGTNENNTVFIGDQLFTDVYGAKRANIKTILVKPIHPKEEIQIVLKRKLERVVLYFYKRSKKREN